MAYATPMDATTVDPYGGFAHWNIRPAATPTAISNEAPAFGGSKQSKGDVKTHAPLDVDSSTTGKRSNALSQYSRVVPASGDMRNSVYDDLSLHSALFVSRALIDAPGTAYQRLSKVLGTRGINSQLADHTFAREDLVHVNLTGTLVDMDAADLDELGRPIAHCVRAPTWGDQVDTIDVRTRSLKRRYRTERQEDLDAMDDEMRRARSSGLRPEDLEALEALEAMRGDRVRQLNKHYEGRVRDDSEDVLSDGLRGALRVLDEWRFDGVVQMSELKEAREGSLGTSHMLFNIGVRGPSLLRNGSSNGAAFSFSHPTHDERVAVFDEAIEPRYDLLIGLHIVPAPPVRGAPRFRFQYRYTSTRRLWKAAAAVQQGNRRADADNLTAAADRDSFLRRWEARTLADLGTEDDHPDLASMRSLVGAWRVGSVIDAKASVAPNEYGGPNERSVQVQASVDGSWVGLRELRERYGTTYGEDDDDNDDDEVSGAVDQLRMALGAEWGWKASIDAALLGRQTSNNRASDDLKAASERITTSAYRALGGAINGAHGEITIGKLTTHLEGMEIGDMTEDEQRRLTRVKRTLNALGNAIVDFGNAQQIVDDEANVFTQIKEVMSTRYGRDARAHPDEIASIASDFARAEELYGTLTSGAMASTARLRRAMYATLDAFERDVRSLNVPTAMSLDPSTATTATTIPEVQILHDILAQYEHMETDITDRSRERTTLTAMSRFRVAGAKDGVASDEVAAMKRALEAVLTVDEEVRGFVRENGPRMGRIIEDLRSDRKTATLNVDEARRYSDAFRLLNTNDESAVATLKTTMDAYTAAVEMAKAAATAPEEAEAEAAEAAETAEPPATMPLSAPSTDAAGLGVRPTAADAPSPVGSLVSGDDRSDRVLPARPSVGAAVTKSKTKGTARVRPRASSPTDDDGDVFVMPPPPPPTSNRKGSASNPRARSSKGASGASTPLAPPVPPAPPTP